MAKLTLVTFVAALLGLAAAYPTGAPEKICDTMEPLHGYDPQESAIPYTATPLVNKLKVGDKVEITIKGKNPFKGFLIQVRDVNETPVGKFNVGEDDKDARTINCSGDNTAATHKHPEYKDSVTLEWIAPEKPGTYTIYLTIVEKFEKYWVRKPLGTITVE